MDIVKVQRAFKILFLDDLGMRMGFMKHHYKKIMLGCRREWSIS